MPLGAIGIEREEAGPFSVDGDLDLLCTALNASEQRTVDGIIKGQLENIIAVHRKLVNHRNSAACSYRRARHVPGLADFFREQKGRDFRLNFRVADSKPANFAGGADISVQKSRGSRQHVGHIVKAMAMYVRRQQGTDLDS